MLWLFTCCLLLLSPAALTHIHHDEKVDDGGGAPEPPVKDVSATADGAAPAERRATPLSPQQA